MFEDVFFRRTFCADKLANYGFLQSSAGLRFETDLAGTEFRLTVLIAPNGAVDTVLTDENGETYDLYKTAATGEFVGKIRERVRAALQNIAENCCESTVFQSPQIAEFLKYARLKYGGAPEFLWKDSPKTAILRRSDNQKWYAVLQTVSGGKLGITSNGDVEILNFKGKPEQIEKLIDRKRFFPAWHMNKKHWYTLLPDGDISAQTLRTLADESYRLAK